MIQLHRQAAKSAYPFRTALTRSSNVQLNQLIQLRLRNLPSAVRRYSSLPVSMQQAILLLKLRPLKMRDKLYFEGIVNRTMKRNPLAALVINVFPANPCSHMFSYGRPMRDSCGYITVIRFDAQKPQFITIHSTCNSVFRSADLTN